VDTASNKTNLKDKKVVLNFKARMIKIKKHNQIINHQNNNNHQIKSLRIVESSKTHNKSLRNQKK
jgi:hypothetical protein